MTQLMLETPPLGFRETPCQEAPPQHRSVCHRLGREPEASIVLALICSLSADRRPVRLQRAHSQCLCLIVGSRPFLLLPLGDALEQALCRSVPGVAADVLRRSLLIHENWNSSRTEALPQCVQGCNESVPARWTGLLGTTPWLQ